MKTYTFPIRVEPDEDKWLAYVPGLEGQGWATSGTSKDEAIRNMQEVAQLSIEIMLQDGEPLPECVSIAEGLIR
ncbi:MAG: type II toxin-antitoxin system HicB family antitoxin [Candidatus Sumerlaeaceae bacterium]